MSYCCWLCPLRSFFFDYGCKVKHKPHFSIYHFPSNIIPNLTNRQFMLHFIVFYGIPEKVFMIFFWKKNWHRWVIYRVSYRKNMNFSSSKLSFPSFFLGYLAWWALVKNNSNVRKKTGKELMRYQCEIIGDSTFVIAWKATPCVTEVHNRRKRGCPRTKSLHQLISLEGCTWLAVYCPPGS